MGYAYFTDVFSCLISLINFCDYRLCYWLVYLDFLAFALGSKSFFTASRPAERGYAMASRPSVFPSACDVTLVSFDFFYIIT